MDLPKDNLYQGYMDQKATLHSKKILCEETIAESFPPDNDIYCPMIWDGVMCWPFVPAGTHYNMLCPPYVHGFNKKALASKFCTTEGTWWLNENFNQTWTNYSLCTQKEPVELEITTYSAGFYQNEQLSSSPSSGGIPTAQCEQFLQNIKMFNHVLTQIKLYENKNIWSTPRVIDLNISKPHLSAIKLISKIGYTVSFSTLIVAFLILTFLRKLQCPRNNLHIQLFLSFMMRALMFLLKDALFVAGMGLQSNVVVSEDGLPRFLESKNNIDCKIFISFWHYFLMANYCWIFMEGLYLHNLIILAMFTDTSSISRYVIMGWTLPIPFIVPWIIIRALLEDKLCWTTNENSGYFWIIRAPITLSILVNFIFFINITRVLFLKMFVPLTMQIRRYRYRKWFRSTLVLVPLFGVHYAILLGMSFSAGVNKLVELIWLYIDILFSSFQGFFVALLYCFCNGEVQQELHKLWLRWSIRRTFSLRSQQSILTQSLSYLSRGRSSVQSLHSTAVERRDVIQSTNPSPCISLQDNYCESMSIRPTPNTSSLMHMFLYDDCKKQDHSSVELVPVSCSNKTLSSDYDSPRMSSKDKSFNTKAEKHKKTKLFQITKYRERGHRESSL